MQAPIDWLLEGDPWIEYRTRRDLLKQPEQDSRVQSARDAMLASAPVQSLLTELSNGPVTVLASHKSAGQLFHKLTFIADLGLTADDPGMQPIISEIMQHQSAEGPFRIPMNIPGDQAGSAEVQWAWALCDAPLILYALTKFGLEQHPAVQFASTYLAGLVRGNGWPCAVSKELGKFRGPGRKEDPCPFANLAMLKAFAASNTWRDHPASRIGAETLLNLWNESATQHPYMFFMGTDFRKLKLPLVWYDIVHVLDVLSNFQWLKTDPRLLDMLAILKSKADSEGRFTLESVWTSWKDWEFGQKKTPSRWLTLHAWRVINRLTIVDDPARAEPLG